MAKAQNEEVRLHWESHGAATAPPMLLIAGLGTSSTAWTKLIPYLAKSLRPIVFDNRGTGRSDRPRGPYTIEQLVGDALAVLDVAGVEKAHLMGFSMGGMVAQHLALEHPDRVESLVLMGTQAAAGAGKGVSLRWLAAVALRPLVGPGRTFWLTAPAAYSERTRRERRELLLEDRRRRFADDTPARTVFSQLAATRTHNLRSQLGQVSKPTLVIHGEEDGVVPISKARELADLIPGAKLAMLSDCGHAVPTEAPEEAAAHALEFLSRDSEPSKQAVSSSTEEEKA